MDRCRSRGCSGCSGGNGCNGCRGPPELALPLEIVEHRRRLIQLRLKTVDDLLSLTKQSGKLDCIGKGVLVERCGFAVLVLWDGRLEGSESSRWSGRSERCRWTSGSESTTVKLLRLWLPADVFLVSTSSNGLKANLLIHVATEAGRLETRRVTTIATKAIRTGLIAERGAIRASACADRSAERGAKRASARAWSTAERGAKPASACA